MGTKYATQRLIDSVWTVAYQEVEGGARILSYNRESPIGYGQEKELPRMGFIESEGRIVVQLVLSPYGAFDYSASASSEGARVLSVINPKNIFNYKGEGAEELGQ
tara:strand:- start:109 stop:423 length:315 start_codon:yes stop_codon:yes gene_type:complete